MKFNTLFLFAFMLLLLASGCKERPSNNQRLIKDTSKIVQDNTIFAVDLYQQLCSSEGNLFFSPYSISTALAMTYAGARGGTEQQIAKALHFTIDQDNLHHEFAEIWAELNQISNVKLNIANSLWPQQGYMFKEEYLSLTKKYYGFSITPLDLLNKPEVTKNTINKWVDEKTGGEIKDIITYIPRESLLVLVNAIYFKGDWKDQFNPALTKDESFHVSSAKTVQIPMMTDQFPIETNHAEVKDLQILELPYVGERISMLILLPKEIDGLKKLESNLSVKNLDIWKKIF